MEGPFSRKTPLLNETHSMAKLPQCVAETRVDAEEEVSVKGASNYVNAIETVTVSENLNHETGDFASSTLKKILQLMRELLGTV